MEECSLPVVVDSKVEIDIPDEEKELDDCQIKHYIENTLDDNTNSDGYEVDGDVLTAGDKFCNIEEDTYLVDCCQSS